MTNTSTPREEHVQVPCRDTFLPGILTYAEPEKRTKDIALMLHGQMAHKNQTYHRPLTKALAQHLEIDSFRFDFAHAKYNQPGWDWQMARISRDVDELRMVIDFLQERYGYKVRILIGHSKGALCSYAYLAQTSDAVPFYVNMSGRYDMQKAKDIIGPKYFPQFEKQGYFEWKIRIQGQEVTARVTPDQFEEFVNHDTSFVRTAFPVHTHVLTIHGDADEVVPVNDGYTYHEILSARSGSGTSTLRIVEGANHNFIGRFDEVVDIIVTWMKQFEAPARSTHRGRL